MLGLGKDLANGLSSPQNVHVSVASPYQSQPDWHAVLALEARHVQCWRVEHGPQGIESLHLGFGVAVSIAYLGKRRRFYGSDQVRIAKPLHN